MIRIKCPFCGDRDHSEFTYGSDGSVIYPSLEASVDEWEKAIFFRKNEYGLQIETWHHTNGCRMWLKIKRSTVDHKIHSIEPCHNQLAKMFGDEK